jgi:hypothetical protein
MWRFDTIANLWWFATTGSSGTVNINFGSQFGMPACAMGALVAKVGSDVYMLGGYGPNSSVTYCMFSFLLLK